MEKNVPTFERPEVLQGVSIKIKPPGSDHAIYLIINHTERPDGSRWPVEVFVNSKDMENFQWVSCITRLLSAVLRQADEFPWYAIDELVDTFDPAGGGYIIPRTRGKKAHGIVSHIGIVLLKHCEEDLGLKRPTKEEGEK